jgi:type I restriction enzyme M protein
MRSELIDANVQVDSCDVFSLVEGDNTLKFDKIFSNYPFKLKLKSLGAGTGYLEQLSERYPGLSKAISSDWVFNVLLCDLLSETGKAIGIMTNGSTGNSVNAPMRKYFVERKMVECVISLPNRMFSSTNNPTTLIVLSHNNDSVRMIDATKICQQGRRQNEFSDEDINAIIEAFSTDSEYSKQVSLEELRSNEYTLSLGCYARKDLSFANGVPFESIIKSVTRGAPCTANQLDKMVSDEITNMQYLMLSNIQNGMIDDKLPYLSSIDPKYEKYCLKNNSLIISKNSYPYKIAVASVMEGQRILANGNLYIIELDEEKANPYYIKAFFDSEQGHAVLKSITVGATIPNIGVDKLRKVKIPLPPMEEQNRISQKYQAVLDEISVIKLRLEKAINRLYHIFDEECD